MDDGTASHRYHSGKPEDKGHWNSDGSYTFIDGQVIPIDQLNEMRNTASFMMPNAPGAQVNTANSDADRGQLGQTITQLQNQAQTGDGSWQQMLAQGTQASNAASTALGQSTPSGSVGAELRNTQNAIGANNQRAVGQANILRSQAEQNATGQLGDILGAQQGMDASQAATNSAINQAKREAQMSLTADQRKQAMNTLSSAGQALLSEGGAVPGKPKVFGDDEANDTVPAWLSPGEVVLPRSVTNSANAPEQAAAFVRAVQARHGGGTQHFAQGGVTEGTGWTNGDAGIQKSSANTELEYGGNSYQPGGENYREYGGVDNVDINGRPVQKDVTAHPTAIDTGGAASIRNGALFDNSNYDATRAAAQQNNALLANQASGMGPSAAPQEIQNATDSNIASAMQAMANARGPGGAAAGANAVASAAQANQLGAGKAADTASAEQQKGQAAFAHALLAQRTRDMAYAQVQQQAAWRNSMLNAGVTMEQQAQLRNILGGAGQAAVGAGGMLDSLLKDNSKDASSNTGATTSGGAQSSPDEWNSYPGDSGSSSDSSGYGDYSGDVSSGDYAAHGGEVVDSRAKDFVAALKRRAA